MHPQHDKSRQGYPYLIALKGRRAQPVPGARQDENHQPARQHRKEPSRKGSFAKASERATKAPALALTTKEPCFEVLIRIAHELGIQDQECADITEEELLVLILKHLSTL